MFYLPLIYEPELNKWKRTFYSSKQPILHFQNATVFLYIHTSIYKHYGYDVWKKMFILISHDVDDVGKELPLPEISYIIFIIHAFHAQIILYIHSTYMGTPRRHVILVWKLLFIITAPIPHMQKIYMLYMYASLFAYTFN